MPTEGRAHPILDDNATTDTRLDEILSPTVLYSNTTTPIKLLESLPSTIRNAERTRRRHAARTRIKSEANNNDDDDYDGLLLSPFPSPSSFC